MSQSFAFGFFSEDDPTQHDAEMHDEAVPKEAVSLSGIEQPEYHSFEDLLTSLPATISYAQHAIHLHNGTSICLPRRELFDIRAQAMTESDPSATTTGSHLTADFAAGQSVDDIVAGVYEGGFKTWECAGDLARYVLESGLIEDKGPALHVIELGAGTALPSCAILHRLLAQFPSSAPTRVATMLIADFNAPVLHLSSGPNLFLSALAALDLLLPEQDSNALDIEPSSTLGAALVRALAARNIQLGLMSGAWSPEFVELVQSRGVFAAGRPEPGGGQEANAHLLILASETIYAPNSLDAFARTVVALLRCGAAAGYEGRALIAAKRLYFGVGGGTVELERTLKSVAGSISLREVWGSETRGGGVGRCIIEVRLE